MTIPVHRRTALSLARRLVELARPTPRAPFQQRVTAAIGRLEPGVMIRGALALIQVATGQAPSLLMLGPGEAEITFPGREPDLAADVLDAVSRLGQLPITVEQDPVKRGCFHVSWPPAPGLRSWLASAVRHRASSEVVPRLQLEFDRAREESGRLEGLVRTLVDTVAQRDQALALSEARYRALVEDVAIGIFLVDVEGRVVFASPRAASMLGIGDGRAPGPDLDSLIEIHDAPGLDDRLSVIRADLTTIELEASRRRDRPASPTDESGEEHLRITLSPLDGGPRLVGSVQRTAGPDISRRLIEAQRLEALGRMSSALAHQVNNPAATVRLNLEMLRQQVAGLDARTPGLDAREVDQMSTSVEEAVTAFGRIEATLTDLLAFSGEQQPRLKPCDVDQAIARAVRLVEDRLCRVATLELDFAARCDVRADEALFTQLLANLLTNAATAIEHSTRLPGSIRVCSRRVRDVVTIEVFDTGCGLDPLELPRMSQPLVTGWTAAPSTGLGLATCVRVLGLIGGTLEVDSRVGGPTKFIVTLPAVTVEATGRGSPQDIARARPTDRHLDRRRILMVDDERPILRAVERLLKSRHDVTTVESIDQLEKLLDDGARFDLVLCDLMMPQRTIMSSYDELRGRHPWIAQKTVICTAGGFSDDAKRFVAEKRLRMLEKPFTPEELDEVIAEVAVSQSDP